MDDTSAHTDPVPSGVWIHPTGNVMEVGRRDDGWHIVARMSALGTTTERDYVFDEPFQALAAITGLEQQGYVRDPDRKPGEPQSRSQWTPANVIGAAVFLVVVLAVGMMLLS